MATRRDSAFDGISVLDQDGDEYESDSSMSMSGLASGNHQPQNNGNQLQELKEHLPAKSRARIFLDNFCTFIAHVRGKLSPQNELDLATETHLTGLEDTLVILLQTYLKYPDDNDLNSANAVVAIRQIQKSLQAFQKYVR